MCGYTAVPKEGRTSYPYMLIGKVWIYWLMSVFCLFVRLRISLMRIKLAASNFARWLTGILGREFFTLGNFAPQKPKVGRICHPYSLMNAIRKMWFQLPRTFTPTSWGNRLWDPL